MSKSYTQFISSIYVIPVYTLVALFFFIFNPQSLSFSYGDGDGKYADRVDSFSEYIIRNTIKRNILNSEDTSFFPIVTKGYKRENYKYHAENYSKYYSNASLQTVPATLIAKLFSIDTERGLDRYFGLLRLINALLFSFFLSVLFFNFCKSQNIKHDFLTPIVIGGSAGFVFFSQNLYFTSALMIMPAFYIALHLNISQRFSRISILILGVIYFLRGYEFATVFALLTAFSAAIFTDGDWSQRFKSSFVAFSLICLSFVISITAHVVLVSADSGWVLSLGDSAQNAFATLQHRTASLKGVPVPFSTEFIKEMSERWSFTAFSLTENGPKLTELNVILLMALAAVVRLRVMSKVEKIIFAYGAFGYISWYIFAYQHIMWHEMYDWYIFSLTLGLSFSFLTILYINLFLEYVRRYAAHNDKANG